MRSLFNYARVLVATLWTFILGLVIAFMFAPFAFAGDGLPVLNTVLAGLQSPSVVTYGGMALEVILRLWPTANPYGVLLAICGVLDKAITLAGNILTIASQLVDCVRALDTALNSLVPQKLKAPAAPAPQAPSA